MKILKMTAVIILMTGIAYAAYGAFAIYVASLNVADLTPMMAHDVYATGVSWEEWKRSFFRGGAYAMGLGVIAVIAGIGIMKGKSWGRTIWLFLSPILLLTQFSEGQKSLTQFKTQSSYQLALALLIVIALSWLMLLFPSSRRELAKKDPTAA
jgi:hypothetical protein